MRNKIIAVFTILILCSTLFLYICFSQNAKLTDRSFGSFICKANPLNEPILVAPANNLSNVSTSPPLSVRVSDPEARSTNVSFYGRLKPALSQEPDFSIIVIPDAQNYTASLNGGLPAMFISQTTWCVNQKSTLNIPYVVMVGDIINDNNTTQWEIALTAMSILESPSPGIPYSISAGNHDGAPNDLSLYNEYFGISRFSSKSYYGDSYSVDNNNHYFNLFTVSGMEFIVINLGFGTNSPVSAEFDEVLAWANNKLQEYINRRAIVVNHDLLSGNNWHGPGNLIYDALKDNPNLFLMLCGHLDTEGLRTDKYNNNTIYTIRSDYQTTASGGNGWLRILKFSPVNNNITVSSYSPYSSESNYGGSTPFTLDYSMTPVNNYQLIGTKMGVASGSTCNITWSALDANKEYEWYVTVSVDENTVTGPAWSFTTTIPNVWTGSGTSSDWNDIGNWSNHEVPSAENEVVIQDGAYHPSINGVIQCSNLIIQPLANFNILAGAEFEVSGNLIVDQSASLTIESTLTSSGSLIVGGISTGNVTYIRQMQTAANNGNYHYFASPVGGQTIADFKTVNTNASNIWAWQETDGTWPEITSGSFTSGRGYNLAQSGGTGSFSFIGSVVNSASIVATSPYANGYTARTTADDYNANALWSRTRSWTNYGGGGWNLLGNPFTSALDAETFISDNSSSFDPSYQALYVYDVLTDAYMYAAASAPGFPVGADFGSVIQAGQGFFVLALYDGIVFDFTSAMRIHDTGKTFAKSAQTSGSEKEADPWPGLLLKLKYGEKEGMTTIVYNEKMSTSLDPGYDVGQFSSDVSVEIFTSLVSGNNGVNYARQALPLQDCSKNIVPVGINLEKGGEVTFSAYSVPIDNYKFYLEYRKMGTFTELGIDAYIVTIPEKTFGTGRFFLHASDKILTDIIKKTGNPGLINLRVWISSGDVIIEGAVSRSKATAEVYNLQGSKIFETRLSVGTYNSFPVPSAVKGVYIVKVTDGAKVTRNKVVIF